MQTGYSHWFYRLFIEQGLNDQIALYLNVVMLVIAIIAIAWVLDFITKSILLKVIATLARKTKTSFDDFFIEHKVFDKLAHVIPAFVVYLTAPSVLSDFEFFVPIVDAATELYMTVVVAFIVHAILGAIGGYLQSLEKLKDKPINSFIQVFKVINYSFAAIFAVSILIGKSPLVLFSALGAAAAVLLLIFKDTILGLVSSVQLSVNDMLRVGDWISREDYGADGDVIEINLTTIKVRNWDNTITTVPPYALISDSFRNWRGMSDSGGRRIKRSINIKMASVKFCNDDDLERFSKIQLVAPFIEKRQAEIEAFNQKVDADKTTQVNGRNFTNLGIFRHYVENYLVKNPALNLDMTMMVRQLQPTEKGIPIEIYCFSSSKEWVIYENIMSDIFDHVIAAVNDFDLEILEVPSGMDIQLGAKYLKA
jgi:miniconductance mechanosensitive channel